MLNSTIVAAAALAMSLVRGCSDDCYGGSLKAYCSGPCRTFDEALAEADGREDSQHCSRDGNLQRWYSGVGTCGELRWVMTRPKPDDFTGYFDASGEMVGAELRTRAGGHGLSAGGALRAGGSRGAP